MEPGNNGVAFPPHLLLAPGQVPLGVVPTAPVNARDGSAIPEELLVGEIAGSLKCEYCPYRVSKKDRMRRHVNTVHYKRAPLSVSSLRLHFWAQRQNQKTLGNGQNQRACAKCTFQVAPLPKATKRRVPPLPPLTNSLPQHPPTSTHHHQHPLQTSQSHSTPPSSHFTRHPPSICTSYPTDAESPHSTNISHY
ncbi:unnamed protein product [Lepeophtheirus salmonis]|uniref:(salmon louse) hypothetical protein n=1 Tax=Lepeophtheirus salmonis TaxID=72036 RepID=A0A7R8CTE8_LEPSM|nr:unnamed protein product [Lepeophtheirus salmonis]CAF2923727.1 unnamed protein product [Lepeophtheirus salmonis]